jgi:hypothetical protein
MCANDFFSELLTVVICKYVKSFCCFNGKIIYCYETDSVGPKLLYRCFNAKLCSPEPLKRVLPNDFSTKRQQHSLKTNKQCALKCKDLVYREDR